MNFTKSQHRRRTVAMAIAAIAIVSLAGCAGGGAAPSNTASAGAGSGAVSNAGPVVVASYGGSFQDAEKTAYFDPFAKASGSSVTGASGAAFPKLKAMVDSGQVDWDVSTSDGPSYVTAATQGLLEPIDYSVVKADGVPKNLKGKYGIGYLAFGQVLASSKTAFPDGMTPKQFFDPSVKARRVMSANPYYTLEFALLADGVKPNKLYPLDVDRAFKVLDRIKSQVVGFKSASDEATLIQQGEVDAAFIGNGRIAGAIQAGANWSYTWDNSINITEYWVIPKGAPNVKGAQQFINYATSPEPQAKMSDTILYGPTNAKAFDRIEKARAAQLPGTPANAAKGVTLNDKWWADNMTKIQARWAQWLLS